MGTRDTGHMVSALKTAAAPGGLTLGGNRRAEEWAFFKVLRFYSIGLLLVFL